jgi:Family of unknown function (DUF6352)
MPDTSADPPRWLTPTDAWLRTLLALPELALVEESCAAEIALHRALVAAPLRPVARAELEAVRDADARANHAMFIAFRDALCAAGTLEAHYLALMRSGAVAIPPVFVDRLVEAIVTPLVDGDSRAGVGPGSDGDRDAGSDAGRNARGDADRNVGVGVGVHANPGADAFEARAAELLHRPQRITLTEGRLLAADLATVDLLNETAGFGDIGRLLVQGNAPMAAVQMAVLTPDNASAFWQRRERHAFVLDLTHELASDIGHGLTFTMTRAHSGLKALARVLERWVAHLLGVRVTITPLQKVDDAAWRWHIGLDVDSMALLNDLYEERAVEPERQQRLISLFRLEFAVPAEMRADVAGKPVYLGLAQRADGTLRLKPQNLLLNLPLAAAM